MGGRYGNDNEMEKYSLRLPAEMKKQLVALYRSRRDGDEAQVGLGEVGD